jgi:hypothetical protein
LRQPIIGRKSVKRKQEIKYISRKTGCKRLWSQNGQKKSGSKAIERFITEVVVTKFGCKTKRCVFCHHLFGRKMPEIILLRLKSWLQMPGFLVVELVPNADKVYSF